MENINTWTQPIPAPTLLTPLTPLPTGTQPLYGREEFATFLHAMVTDTAPRLFAVVQEYGVRVDGRVAAWGMAFEDHAEVISVEGHHRMRTVSPDRALRAYRGGAGVVPRLVWP
ncbi:MULTISPECIES: hypothetical protein [unclassified Streptomyces]|uniref:hypothetical protein n=1 Tax=unclassified Streptomyces TaxID=2593676 RepID=UPI0038294B12